MGKSQISFFNNTGVQTWEVITTSDKYYEIKSLGDNAIYVNIEHSAVDSDKLTTFINNYTDLTTVVSIFNEKGVTTYLNNDLVPTFTIGKAEKIFTGNALFLSLDITDNNLAKVLSDRGCSILDYQIIELEGKKILNVLAFYNERDKVSNRMTITLVNQTGKELNEFQFRFKSEKTLKLYKNLIIRKKVFTINQKDIKLRKLIPKQMSYTIITTKNQVEQLKTIIQKPCKIILCKNFKDAKSISNQKLKTVTLYDPKGEIQQNSIDVLIKNIDNVYMYETTNNRMHKL